jgi:hypothetical protein
MPPHPPISVDPSPALGSLALTNRTASSFAIIFMDLSSMLPNVEEVRRRGGSVRCQVRPQRARRDLCE